MQCLKHSFLKNSLVKKKFHFKLKFSNRTFSKHVVGCPSGDITVPAITTAEWIYSKMEPFHKYTAVECADSGKKYTFEEIRVKAGNFSRSIRKNWNLKHGDTVAVCLANCPEYFVACLGILEAGLVVTTISASYKADEMCKQLLNSSAKIIITQPQIFAEVKKACENIKKDLSIISIKNRENDSLPLGAINFEELINSNIDLPPAKSRRPEDVAFLPYSSGTTGLPKGVEITHRNLVAMNCQTIHPDYLFSQPPSENYQDVMPCVVPMFHIFGFTMIFLQGLSTGMKVLSFPKFSPSTFISGMKNNKMSVLYAVPPLIQFLTNHPDVKPEYLDHLKITISGAAPLGILDEQKFKEKIGKHVPLVQGYGLTEASGTVATLACKKLLNKLENLHGSTGPPIPGTYLKIIKTDDAKGEALGPNETGEILIKGPQIMKGYLNRPEETQKVFLDGWYRSGDIGHVTDDGMLYVTDRLKEIIKVKGFQVAPAELEELIRDFAPVEDAAVIGVPHPLFGEAPRAYVVIKENKKLTPEEVESYVAQKVTKHKHLAGGVEIVQSIPKTASGKILRKQLKQEYEDRLAK